MKNITHSLTQYIRVQKVRIYKQTKKTKKEKITMHVPSWMMG